MARPQVVEGQDRLLAEVDPDALGDVPQRADPDPLDVESA
jgi:hypothetical protein